jgi:hypothetical protein
MEMVLPRGANQWGVYGREQKAADGHDEGGDAETGEFGSGEGVDHV